MTTTKQSWLKRSLAVLLAVIMVMSMGVANVFAAGGEGDGTVPAAGYSTEQTENSTMSLTAGENTYYFDDVADAFGALTDEAIRGDITLTVLNDATWNVTENGNGFYNAMLGVDGTGLIDLKIDLAGHNLAIKGSNQEKQVRVFFNNRFTQVSLIDSASNGKAIENGKENPSFDAASLVLDNAAFQTGVVTTIKNIKISSVGTLPEYAVYCGSNSTIDNAVIEYNEVESDSLQALRMPKSELINSVIKSKSSNGVTILSESVLTDCIIEAKNNAINLYGGNKVTVSGGHYTGTNAVGGSGKAVLQDGVFTGNLSTTGTTNSITIQGGYYKGEQTGEGSFITDGYVGTLIEDTNSPYYGYTHYTPEEIVTYSAEVKLADEDGENISYVAEIEGSLNGETIPDLTETEAGQSITYTVSARQDYILTGVKYASGSDGLKELEKTAYTLSEDGKTLTYTMTTPASDYTLVFTVKEITTDTAVAKIGDVTYNSLTTAMAHLQDNGTLIIQKDITYSDSLDFNKNNVVLDLNGKTLTMDVQAQSNNQSNTYSILVSGGSLTVKDETGKGTVSFHKNNISGIRVEGTGTVLNLTGGTYKDLSLLGSAYSVVLDGTDTKVNFSGGTIKGRISAGGTNSQLNISGSAALETETIGMAISVFSLSAYLGVCDVNMTGGSIYSSGASTTGSELGVINLVNGNFEMTGGTIIGEGSIPTIYKQNSSKKVLIGGSAEISSGDIVIGVQGSMSEDDSEVTISDNAKLKAVKEVLEIEEMERFSYLPKITINGGYFACDEEYIPISNTAYVTFPEDKVLNTKTETEGDYAGYYTLATKESLGGTYYPSEGTGLEPVDYTYQDFDGISDGSNQGLNQVVALTEETYDAGNDEGKYPSESWNAFATAYDAAVAVKSNTNANQMEIDYRTANLSAAYLALQAAAELDVNNLADGTYKIDVGMWKSDMSTPSMSGGAVDPTATLTIDDGKASLELTFGPTYQYMVYGHLMDFFMYQGENLSEAYNYMRMTNEEADAQGGRKEATYANWYKGSSTDNSMTFRKDVEGIDEYSEEYNLPSTVKVDLPYIGTNDELRAYWVGMTVDAMGGYASAILMLNWSSLEAVNVEPTLSLSAYELSMMVGEEQTVTATLKGEISEGYTVTKWESSNPSVATVDNNGKITAKGEGTATITVTATKSGEKDLTKTIAVTVAPAGSEAVKVEKVEVSGSTETATLTGNFLTSGSTDGITVNGNTITVDAKADASGITASKVVIPQETAKALLGKTVVVETSTGSISLNSTLLAQIAGVENGVTLSISKASTPVGLGTFSSAYEISLVDANGDAVEFGEGQATVTVTSEETVNYAYCIDNGQRTERVATSTSGNSVSFTVSHFSLWALSDREYEVGGSASTGFFLEDGNYYVDIDLWKSDSNEASMGNVAFKNNDKALVTVKDGKITKVQIGTNPVDIDPYHSAIISFELADGTKVKIEAKGDLTTIPANKDYTYIKLVSFNLPDSAQPDIKDAVTYVPVNFYVPDTPMDAAVGETLTARLRFTWSTAVKTNDTSLQVDDTTAAGDSPITGEEIVDVNLVDEATGIKLETNSGILSDKAVLSVEKLTQGADYDIAMKAMNGVDGSWNLYKITALVDGVETAPLGSVVLYIPCGAEGMTLYRVNTDGTKTLVRGEVQDGYYVVRTTSLGLFAMVGEAAGTPGGTQDGNQNSNTNIPQTGDNSNVAVYALLALAASGMMGVALVTKKRKSEEA